MRPGWRFLSDQRGAAAVELALILPLAVGIMLVTTDAAYYMLSEQRAVQGVRNAARYAARLNLSDFACPGGRFTGSLAAVQNMAVYGSPDELTPFVKGWKPADVTVSVNCTPNQKGMYEAMGGNAPKVRVSTKFPSPSLMREFGMPALNLLVAAEAESPVVGI